jgi:hypothetical protein
MELIRQFQPGHKSSLLADNPSTQLFVELAAMMHQADSFQLRAGPLDETVDLICALSKEPGQTGLALNPSVSYPAMGAKNEE